MDSPEFFYQTVVRITALMNTSLIACNPILPCLIVEVEKKMHSCFIQHYHMHFIYTLRYSIYILHIYIHIYQMDNLLFPHFVIYCSTSAIIIAGS